MDDRIVNDIVPYQPKTQVLHFEGIPTGIELDGRWKPITESDSYRGRQLCYGLAALLLLSVFFAGVYLFYLHFTKLGFFESMRFWVIGLALPPFCVWSIFKQGFYSIDYASIRGIIGMISVLLVAGFTFALYHFWLPAVDSLLWKILICIPGYLLIPALLADVIINIPNRTCIAWRKRE